jgi:hypothetical protein
MEGGFVQPKLRIGQSHDVYEQEAERAADAIMRWPEPNLPQKQEDGVEVDLHHLPKEAPSTIQRQEPEDEEILQKKGSFNTKLEATNEQEREVQALRGGGEPLSRHDRGLFEPFFSRDLSQVRVHTDSNAAGLAHNLDALAFTIGQDIAFAFGNFSPATTEGRRLLAHELTHTVQQSEDKSRSKQVTKKLSCLVLQRQQRNRPSTIVPDLNESTVSDLYPRLLNAQTAETRQKMIDEIVKDRKDKGEDFGIMECGKPIYVDKFPEGGDDVTRDGRTLPPEGDKKKPRVYIGPNAFRKEAPGEQRSKEMFARMLVHLYTSIVHEYRHALQWKKPARREKLGKAGREVDALFWELEQSKRTGLSGQVEYKHVLEQAALTWTEFQNSEEWKKLEQAEKEKFKRRHDSLLPAEKK